MNSNIADNKVGTVKQYITHALTGLYDEREADNIALQLFRHFAHWNRMQLLLNHNEKLSESEILKYHFAVKRLLQNEPVQYVTGHAFFYGMDLKVNKHVLIPRPETEELVQLAINACQQQGPAILDIGTGSGCIAIALKKNIPDSIVTAMDISADALEVAKENALANEAQINFVEKDILSAEKLDEMYDLIVSNPPYVLQSDKSNMHKNVVEYEPHTALFVQDEDALIFYKKIIQLSKSNLNKNGIVICEMHEGKLEAMSTLLQSEKIDQFKFHEDLQGKIRFVSYTI